MGSDPGAPPIPILEAEDDGDLLVLQVAADAAAKAKESEARAAAAEQKAKAAEAKEQAKQEAAQKV